MSRVLGVLLLVALLAPGLAQAKAPESYPAPVVALLDGWIGEAQAAGEGQQEAAWWPEAERFLTQAREAADAGRVRLTLFHLETFHELAITGKLLDEANASFRTDAERKPFVIDRVHAMRDEADRAWQDYRFQLHAFDGNLTSVHAAEIALYSADVALSGRLNGASLSYVEGEFRKQPGLPKGYVLALARASGGITPTLGYASDILEIAAEQEGLPPALRSDNWTATREAVLVPVPAEEVPSHLQDMEALAAPARENGEAMLALAIGLAEERASRAQTMGTIFGDARSRGLSVTQDAARGMSRQLNDTSLEPARAYGLLGLQVASAIDHAVYVESLVAEGKADLGVVIQAWSALDHAAYASNVLGAASSVQPAPTQAESPGPGALALVAGFAVAAALLRRR